jgi:hypothetical protein
MTDKEVMQMALGALESVYGKGKKCDAAIKTLRAALAQPERAECDGGQCGIGGYCKQCPKAQPESEREAYTTGHCEENLKPGGCQLHNLHCGYPACDRKTVTAPPQREWVGLTHEEKMEILTRSITAPSRIEVAEAFLKEKNSG